MVYHSTETYLLNYSPLRDGVGSHIPFPPVSQLLCAILLVPESLTLSPQVHSKPCCPCLQFLSPESYDALFAWHPLIPSQSSHTDPYILP